VKYLSNLAAYKKSRVQATFQEAWGFCCGYEMKLLAVDSSKKHACLTKLSKSKIRTSSQMKNENSYVAIK
jgi:hypothetical protein